MISFNPPDLPTKFKVAWDILEPALGSSAFPAYFEYGIDLHEWDDQEITPETLIEDLWISEGGEMPLISLSEFIELARSYKEAKIVDRSVVHLETKSIYYVVAANSFADALGYGSGTLKLPANECEIGGAIYRAKLIKASLMFGLIIAGEGSCDIDHMPSYSDDYFYIEVECPTNASHELRECVLEAFLYELERSTELAFRPTRFPEFVDELELDELVEQAEEQIGTRMRPMLMGKGVSDLQRIFNSASRSEDDALKFLGYVRVLEYVSASIVRKATYDELRSKLLLPEALNPSAEYIDFLQQTLEQLRSFKGDAEALKLTVETCSDAAVLAKESPRCLTTLRSITPTSKLDDKRKALRELADTISSTRNQLSHAKPNYSFRGSECPVDQFPELIRCTRFAAQEAIQFFADMPERLRVT